MIEKTDNKNTKQNKNRHKKKIKRHNSSNYNIKKLKQLMTQRTAQNLHTAA